MEFGALGQEWALQAGFNQGHWAPIVEAHWMSPSVLTVCFSLLELHGGKSWAWFISPPSVPSTLQVVQLVTARVPRMDK